MAGSVTNLIQGAGVLYVGAFGATEPADSAIGEAPASADWTDVGFTEGGVEFSIAQEYAELEVDQIVDIPGTRLTKREFTISTNLAEATLENLNFALNNDGVTNVEAGESTPGTEAFEPDAYAPNQGEPLYRALIFDGIAPNGRPRRIIVRRALQTGDVAFSYSKEDQTVFSVEFGAHYVSNAIKPYKIVDMVAEPTGE